MRIEKLLDIATNNLLEASDEREAIARFIEYTFEKNWVVQDVIDAIRNGSYLEHVRKLVAAQPTLALDGFPPSHRDDPFCECSVCMGFVSHKSAASKA